MGGLMTQVHRPKVCVDQEKMEEALAVLAEFEDWSQERAILQEEAGYQMSAGVLTVVCDACGGETDFSVTLQGTVQTCCHCRAFVDCEPPASEEEDRYWETDPSPEEPSE